MARNDGGPAFPQGYVDGGAYEGMSLRDYFAGQALAGMLSRSINPHGDYRSEDSLASSAYSQADAMLKAREAS